MGAPNLRPMPGPENTVFTNRLVARRKAAIAYAANRALVASAPAPRLDATPVSADPPTESRRPT